jgi:Flp pilus assembly pilin Flp
MNKIRNAQARTHAAMIHRNRRGVSMLEYVLIAAVVITLGGLFVPQLRGAFTGLGSRISDFMGTNAG